MVNAENSTELLVPGELGTCQRPVEIARKPAESTCDTGARGQLQTGSGVRNYWDWAQSGLRLPMLGSPVANKEAR